MNSLNFVSRLAAERRDKKEKNKTRPLIITMLTRPDNTAAYKKTPNLITRTMPSGFDIVKRTFLVRK